MRAVLQRVSGAKVEVDGTVAGSIGTGLLVLLGVARGDTAADAAWLVEKVVGLRLFPDDSGKMNRSVEEADGELLVISQFTLYGDCRRGRRPGFDEAAPPQEARKLYELFLDLCRARGVPVKSGVFQAHMAVHLVNDGPVTVICDSPRKSLTEPPAS